MEEKEEVVLPWRMEPNFCMHAEQRKKQESLQSC